MFHCEQRLVEHMLFVDDIRAPIPASWLVHYCHDGARIQIFSIIFSVQFMRQAEYYEVSRALYLITLRIQWICTFL